MPDIPTFNKQVLTSDEERLEKQEYLIELANLQQKGVKLSRDFTLNDSVAELEFEINSQNANLNTRNAVRFCLDSIKVAANFIEIGNAKYGPFIELDGWAESTFGGDMKRYEHVFERIYRRYWRKNQMSPLMELAWLILGSMVTWHFKSKFFGQPRRETSQPQTSRAPPTRPAPARKDAGVRTRPILRPPGSLFV